MHARLQVMGGPFAGQSIDICGGKLVIGREEDCHLRPDSEFVSRHHCALLLDDYTLRIRDLGSKNGTFVNGRRIGTGDTILLHDDVISVGETTLLIDLNQPRTQQPEAQPALEGTGVFEGETVPSETPAVDPPRADPQAIVPPMTER
jgi:pSer/pThr/pTyr-binding forkhead associated (FHA) protein